MRGEKQKSEAFKRLFPFPLVRHTGMTEDVKSYTMRLCTSACEANPTDNQSAAQMIKESMDRKQGGSWHAVVGEQFGLEVSHESGSILYMFFGDNLAVCVWKCS